MNQVNRNFEISLIGHPKNAGAQTNTNLSLYSDGTTRSGFIGVPGIPISALNTISPAPVYGPGVFGVFDESGNTVDITDPECCDLYIYGASPYSKDKIAPLYGGWQMPIKSKKINPRLIRKFTRIDRCSPFPFVGHLGTTPATSGVINTALDIEILSVTCSGTLTIPNCPTTTNVNVGTSTIVSSANPTASLLGSFDICLNPNTNQYQISAVSVSTNNVSDGDIFEVIIGNSPNTCTIRFKVANVAEANNQCCYEFRCDTTYHFGFEIMATPVLQAYQRRIFKHLSVYTGCCDPSNPNAVYVNPGYVYYQLAQAIIKDPELSKFVYPIIWASNIPFYPPAGLYEGVTPPAGASTYNDFVNGGLADQSLAVNPYCPFARFGITLVGAYVETRFKDCTFHINDGFNYDPIKVNWAGLVDDVGNKCASNLCWYVECYGHKGEGSGEAVVRKIYESEFNRGFEWNIQDDLRIREVMLGDEILSYASRTNRYYQYQLWFSENNFYNNPEVVNNNPLWQVNIYTLLPIPAFENYFNLLFTRCGSPCSRLEVVPCATCEIDSFTLPTGVTLS